MKQPTVARVGGLYRLDWSEEKIALEIDRVNEHSDETRGQLTALSAGLVLAQFGYNLTSLPARDKAAKYLRERHETDWGMALEMASFHILKRLREGEPRVDLSMNDAVVPVTWLLRPLLLQNQPTMIFADGGTGKSYVSLLVSMLVGFPWVDNPFGWKTPDNPVTSLYLDWETDENTTKYRLQRICRGMDQPKPPLEYRHCSRSFIMDLAAIQRHVLESKAGLVIVDSLGMACGGDLKEQTSATTFFQALRELQVSALLLTHVSKDEMRKTKTAFGSVYFQNHARSVWEMSGMVSRDGEDHATINVGLFQRKHNEMALSKPLALGIEFNNLLDTTVFRSADLADLPDLRDKLTLKDQIRELLKSGAKSVTDLADETGKKEDAIRMTLNRYKTTFTRVGNDWGLLTKESIS
jgi:hypothetical protein